MHKWGNSANMPDLLPASSLADVSEPAIDQLSRGRCVALPTETVYGLAADATDGEAVARIFEMKGRPRFNPLIVHVSDVQMAGRFGQLDEVSKKLAKRFWPGPLTLVVPRTPDCPVHELATAGLDTIALRCPDSIAGEIVSAFGKPLAAPSANRSGRISPTTAQHVASEFAGEDLLILDDGPCPVGIESTIVKVDGNRLVILRPGSVTGDMLTAATGLPVVTNGGEAIQAPGMMQSHYAPRASLLVNRTRCLENAALLAFGPANGRVRSGAVAIRNLSETGDLREAAANLYAHLKALDAEGTANICVEPVPMTGLGLAINDRLQRAAAPRDCS